MMGNNSLKKIYSLKGQDAQKWLEAAKRLKLSADLIWPHLLEVMRSSSIKQDIQDKRLAYMESYMMLVGFAFENLLKGIDIAKNPSLVDTNRIDTKKLWRARGGHSISTFALRHTSLNPEEEDLLKRLEEFVYWAGRYPISKSSETFSKSIEPRNLTSVSSKDQEIIDRLFKQLSKYLIEEWQKRIKR